MQTRLICVSTVAGVRLIGSQGRVPALLAVLGQKQARGSVCLVWSAVLQARAMSAAWLCHGRHSLLGGWGSTINRSTMCGRELH